MPISRRLPSEGPSLSARLRFRLVSRGVRHIARRLVAAVGWPFVALRSWRVAPPPRLLIAPQDIRTTDPTIANDIYAGYFAFGGKIVNAHGVSPFELTPPSEPWARVLHSFGWLRHLRAADTALARGNARALIDDWLDSVSRSRAPAAFETRVVARRMLSWISQSPLVLDGAEIGFYQRFMRALGRHRVMLRRALAGPIEGEARLVAAIALAELALCAPASAATRRRAAKLLSAELDGQILADGGHISRNPQVGVDLLLDLLPLRQAYAARGVQAPAAMLNAIDRMLPMLRLFRHGDGALALFNGMGATAPDLTAAIFAHFEARGAALLNAPLSGYQRLEAGDACLIVDCGRPPPAPVSASAHAGTLAFEFSDRETRLIVNCGAPDAFRDAYRGFARVTAAHSTLTIEDTSSYRFIAPSRIAGALVGQVLDGPSSVPVERATDHRGFVVEASHDGYADRFRLIHQRVLILSRDGAVLRGEDRLIAAGKRSPPASATYAIRFHLHPAVALRRLRPDAIVLSSDTGASFLFEVPGRAIAIEESIFFAAPTGPQRTDQLVIGGDTRSDPVTSWSLARMAT